MPAQLKSEHEHIKTEETASAKALSQEQGMFQGQKEASVEEARERKVRDDDGEAGGNQITQGFEGQSEELPIFSKNPEEEEALGAGWKSCLSAGSARAHGYQPQSCLLTFAQADLPAWDALSFPLTCPASLQPTLPQEALPDS